MQPAERRAHGEFLRQAWWALPLLVLVWFRALELPDHATTPALDDSWRAVKAWEFQQPLRLGIDSVFTYGRLGWLHGTVFAPELHSWKVWGWEIGFKLLVAGLCVLAVARTPGRLARGLFALALLAFPPQADAFACLALLAIFAWILREPRRDGRAELALLAAAALLAQVKFTWFVLWASAVVLAASALWIEVARARAAAFLLRALGSFAFLWLLLGQSLRDLPRWLASSLEIAGGYVDGMSVAGPPAELGLALALLALLALFLALELARSPRSYRTAAQAVLALLAAGLAFRNAFTRQIASAAIFFAVGAAAGWFTLVPQDPARLPRALELLRTGLRAALLLAAVAGLALASPDLGSFLERQLAVAARSWDALAGIGDLRGRLEQEQARLEQAWSLPRTSRSVGLETVDVFQSAAGIALLNHWNYHPRPVFQSYSAYTPELLEQNRAFVAGADAPRFVLFRLDSIDGRLAAAEDGPAFEELLARYEPRHVEAGWLLLERADAPRARAKPLAWTGEVVLGEWIELAGEGGEALELSLAPRRSLHGELQTLALRGPELACEAEFADGRVTRARVVARTLGCGVLVRPWIETQDDVLRLVCGERWTGPARVRLVAAAGEDALWQRRVAARLVRIEGLLPAPRPELLARLRFATFDPPPAEVVLAAGLRPAEIEGRAVALLQAPSALRWALEPGRYRLHMTYGMPAEAWQGEPKSDGALVFVVLQSGAEPRQLLRRLLDPAAHVEDRGRQPLRLEFAVEEPAQLYLRLRVGWHEDATSDWVYCESFVLERL